MNVLVIHVNTVEHVTIKLMDLTAPVRLDSQVDILSVVLWPFLYVFRCFSIIN